MFEREIIDLKNKIKNIESNDVLRDVLNLMSKIDGYLNSIESRLIFMQNMVQYDLPPEETEEAFSEENTIH